MKVALKKKFGVHHVFAECKNCEWKTENHKNGQALAALHAKKHGHRVQGDIGLHFFYDGSQG